MQISIPELSLVVLIGASGSGKSTFAARHFLATEVLSSDRCRGWVADDENDQAATPDAFQVLHFIAAKRLAAGRLTVVDATNVQKEGRQQLVKLAREYHVIPVAMVLNMPERLCQERNAHRPDRQFGPHVVRNQCRHLRQSLRHLKREGFRHVKILDDPQTLESVSLVREPLWTNKRQCHGPFDIIGDIHGCAAELDELLVALGYHIEDSRVIPPPGRQAVFLGDLVDRGPNSPRVLRRVMGMVADGSALCVPGNHDIKLLRKLNGKNPQLSHGLAETVAQLDQESAEFHQQVRDFIDGLVSHYVLDDGKLVVAHAGMKAEYQGRGSATVRSFALYGDTTGETDAFGLPVRYPWASEYRGKAAVVYGHTPVTEPQWLNNTLCIDTGCVFGGRLTALRYPERELVSVAARQTYYAPPRPAPVETLSAQQQDDDLLDIQDVLGKRFIHTGERQIIIHEENALAALETLSRFAVNPRWLNYLPPTMSPTETSQREGYLEHPAEALDYYRQQGVATVICQEKHMGSRAVVQLCRDADTARRRFGIEDGTSGIVYSRGGRRFFKDAHLEQALLHRLRTAVDQAGLWKTLDSDWLTLDAELMPWSLKAEELLRQQYAGVGAAGTAALGEVVASLTAARARGLPVAALLAQQRQRLEDLGAYREAYRRYCWPVEGIDDLRLAPFHLLASEGRLHSDRDHRWHMETLARLSSPEEPLLLATAHRLVDLDDESQCQTACDWWQQRVEAGGEGMVVKPLDFVPRGRQGPVQPAVKCRGPAYLRIIYGPEYCEATHLEQLRQRGLGGKRQLALREFRLGLEGLQRFVERRPLREVHECVLAVLALESEPVDPRL